MPYLPRGILFLLFLLVSAFVLCSSAATLDAEERQVSVKVDEIDENLEPVQCLSDLFVAMVLLFVPQVFCFLVKDAEEI